MSGNRVALSHVFSRLGYAAGLSLALFTAGSRGEEPGTGWNRGLKLRNGDFLAVDQIRVEPGGFRVHPPWAEDSVRVPFHDVAYWMRPQEAPMKMSDVRAVVGTRDGGQVTGGALTLEQNRLEVVPLYGSVLDASWEDVSRIRFFPENRLLFYGPASGQEWEIRGRSGQWMPNPFAGRLLSTRPGQIQSSPPFSLPSRFLLEAELSFAQEEKNFRLHFTPMRQESRGRGNVTLIFTDDSVTGQWMAKMDERRWHRKTWNVEVPLKGQFHRIRLAGDRQAKTLTLVLNGEVLKTFPLPHLERDAGFDHASFGIQSVKAGNESVLDAVAVLKWNGGEVPVFARPSSGDRVVLYDGSSLPGRVTRITADEVVLDRENGKGPLRIPRERVYEIVRPEGVSDSDPKNELSMIYSGYPGDRFRMRFHKIEGNRLVGASPVWGDPVRIPFEGVRFWRPGSVVEVSE